MLRSASRVIIILTVLFASSILISSLAYAHGHLDESRFTVNKTDCVDEKIGVRIMFSVVAVEGTISERIEVLELRNPKMKFIIHTILPGANYPSKQYAFWIEMYDTMVGVDIFTFMGQLIKNYLGVPELTEQVELTLKNCLDQQ